MKKLLVLACLMLAFAVSAFAQMAKEPTATRAQFTTGITDREPADNITEIDRATNTRVFFFTELSNMEGMAITHQWKRNGEVVFTLNVKPAGPRWRANSSMSMDHFKAGDVITVTVADNAGKSFAEMTLNVK